MLLIGDADVAALADWPDAIAALREAYSRPVDPQRVPPRVMARGEGFWLRGLCAISPSGEYMGCKLIAASPKARRASYLIALFDQRSMELMALLDGNRITGIRTAATAALAVDLIAGNASPPSLAVIGSGFEARNLLAAVMSVRPLASISIYSPTLLNRERFASSLQGTSAVPVRATATAAAAVQSADVVLCAARSRDESPVLQGQWLKSGAIVVSIGSTLPEQREVDEETMRRAESIVADMPNEVLHQTGDALAATRAGVDVASRLVSLNEAASRAAHSGVRRTPESIVLYKSVGSALQDIVTAEALLRRARATGRFKLMPPVVLTVEK
jgi:ornithine cyclodeaminase/alanine dehydrogenase